MRKLDLHSARGFTVLELVVVIAVLFSMLVAVALLLRPQRAPIAGRNAERRTALASLAQGLRRYEIDNQGLPPSIPTVATPIGSIDTAYNLCTYLVPTYLAQIPIDPLSGVKLDIKTQEDTTASCADIDTEYLSGYTVYRAKDGSVVLGVTRPEGNERISFTYRR